MPNNNVIGLLFGVKGGASIDRGSGKIIKETLQQIVKNIEKDLKITIKFNDEEIKKQIEEIKKSSTKSNNSTSNNNKKENQQKVTLRTLKEEYKEYLKAQNDANIKLKREGEIADETRKKVEALKNAYKKTKTTLLNQGKTKGQIEDTENNTWNSLFTKDSNISKTQLRVQSFENLYKDVLKRSPEARKKLDELKNSLNQVLNKGGQTTREDLEKLNKEIFDTETGLKKQETETDTFTNRLKKRLSNLTVEQVAAAAFAALVRALKAVYQNVVLVDKAMTNLQIASGYTREEVEALTHEYADLGRELGSSLTDIAESADTWLRQGYSAKEAGEMIKASTMLSKLGQLDAAEAAKALTSAIRGYKLEVKDATSVVDKFTAVDMEAAISAGDISTAMAETATSADIAGVSMDKLIGYITTVAEVTQDGAESVGTFYKTLFARMNNVKAGKFVDEETSESLNDVEKVLGELDIKLRKIDGTFRDSDDVLDEVAEKWETYDNVQQHALATAFAGTRQQEKFIVLMENYGSALEYASISAGSFGTAEKKMEIYTNSLEGKLGSLEATLQELSTSVLDSDMIKGGIDILNTVLGVLKDIQVGTGGVITNTLLLVAVFRTVVAVSSALPGIITAIKNKLKALNIEVTKVSLSSNIIITSISLLLSIFSLLQDNTAKAAVGITGATAAIIALGVALKVVDGIAKSTIIGAIIGIALLAINGVVALVDELNVTYEELKEKAEEAKNAFKEAQDAVESLENELEKIQDRINELNNKDSLTLTEEGELKLLKQQEGLLKSELSTRKEIAKQKAKDAIKTTKEAIEKHNQENGNKQKADEILKDYNIYGNEYKKWLADYVAEQNNLVDGLEYYVGDNLEQWQKDSNKLLDDTYDMWERYNFASGNIANVWESVINRIKFEPAIKSINELKKSGKLTAEELNKLFNEDANIKGFIQHLIDIGIVTDNSANSLQGLVNQMQDVVTISAHSFSEIASAFSSEFDTLSAALTSATENGIVGIQEITELLENFPHLVDKYFEQTSQGYVVKVGIANDELLKTYAQDYIQSFLDKLAECKEGTEEYRIAQENLNNAIAVAATLLRATEIEKITKAHEDRKEALEKQLDEYKDIIDIRKELLETYKEELDYKKELSKKQENVSNLRTNLVLAQLDKSAAGQARARELQEELNKAEEELNEYTLEHAIEDITKEIDDGYSEYEKLIKEQVSIIEQAIEKIKDNINITVAQDSAGNVVVTNQDGSTETLYKPTQKNEESTSSTPNSNDSSSNVITGTFENLTSDHIQASRMKLNENIFEGTGVQIFHFGLSDEEYRKRLIKDPDGNVYFLHDKANMHYVKQGEGFDSWREEGGRWGVDIHSFKPTYEKYHTGGLVGDTYSLRSNEEFAKLLKGEHVSTPAQMDNFMKKTLPAMVSASQNSGIEYNAPIFEINCDSINENSLPELEEIINQALQKFFKEMKSALSRTGYRK